MRHTHITTPAAAGSANRRQMSASRARHDISNSGESATQPEFSATALAACIMTTRYGVAPHLAEMVAHLAELGGQP